MVQRALLTVVAVALFAMTSNVGPMGVDSEGDAPVPSADVRPGGDSLSVTDERSHEEGGSSGHQGGGAEEASSGGGSGPSRPTGRLERYVVDGQIRIRWVPDAAAPTEGGAEPVVPARVTSREVQSFAPGAAAFTLEPNGWAIAGGHMNAYASATTVTRQASLRGLPVTVTFEPVAYTWSWGDGETIETESGGRSWEALGLADWSQTATSHVYREKGERTVSLQVVYRPAVTYNGRSIPVDGTVTGAAHSAPVLVVESDRALVAHNCIEAPNDPGCR